ncbi:MAG: amino acid ABC transporter permease [Solobacterium sp.]|nr:amino acid ABC transporter permease [Solobacterium sp.]
MGDIFTSENLMFMLRGAGVSLMLALGAIVIGCIIGILFAAAKLSKSKILRVIGNIYVEIFRGTPMLLQVLFFYLGVPVLYQRITGTRMSADPYIVGLIALSCNSGAYQTELIRSGIQSVDKGQWEACETLGILYPTMMKEIILPQAFKLIVPPLVSEFITLIKDSSLISNIGALELLYSAQVLGKRYYDYLDPLILAGIMYLFMTVITSYISKKVERRLAQSD